MRDHSAIGRPADRTDDSAPRQRIRALRIDIDRGLADVAAGRATAFDPQRIVERGRRMAHGAPPSLDRNR